MRVRVPTFVTQRSAFATALPPTSPKPKPLPESFRIAPSHDKNIP
jgi:hypothetical protein